MAKAIQIHHQQCKALTTLAHRIGGRGHALGQVTAIGQPGQDIVQRQGFDALLCRHAFAEVTEGPDPPLGTAGAHQRPRDAVQHLAGVQHEPVGGADQHGLVQRVQPLRIGLGFGHDADVYKRQGYINAIDPFTGASVTNLFFDINNDLKFSDLDRLGVQKRAIGSFDPGINLPSDVVLLSNPGSPAGGPNAAIFASGTSGQTAGGATGLPYRTGRISWRELVTP